MKGNIPDCSRHFEHMFVRCKHGIGERSRSVLLFSIGLRREVLLYCDIAPLDEEIDVPGYCRDVNPVELGNADGRQCL